MQFTLGWLMKETSIKPFVAIKSVEMRGGWATGTSLCRWQE